MATYDAFAFATAVGYNTQRIALSIGPLAVGVRTPMTMAMGIASVADLTGRPTGLALGASSNVVVEHWHGRARARTAKLLDETAQIVRGLLARVAGPLSNPDERRAREDDLGSRGAKPLSGRDVQHDTGSVRARANQQSGQEDGQTCLQRSEGHSDREINTAGDDAFPEGD